MSFWCGRCHGHFDACESYVREVYDDIRCTNILNDRNARFHGADLHSI